jgi:type I restriction enzyme, R subunit
MAQDEYEKVELPAIEQLKQLGWTYIDGEDLSPEHHSKERNSYKDVVLEKRLRSAIQRINSWINDENLNKVVNELIRIQTTTLQEANQSIHETLLHHKSVFQDLGKGNKGQTVKIVDFDNIDNNEFIVTNQFKVSGVLQNIIPDIILFVNGLPLAVIECKSPYITNPMEAGINQLLRYANRRHPEENEGAERLFWYNQLMVSTHRDRARAGTISSRMEHYLEWKDPYPLKPSDIRPEPNSQEVMIAGIFTKANFLDLIQNFIVFEPMDGKVIKKLARYQQFRAVHKTIQRLKTGTTQGGKGGVIWHTQGSGKSLTMVFLAVKMRRDPIMKEYKLVFITDRIQLDSQLTSTFERTQGETVYHAKSVSELKELLQKDCSDLVTATMQKFQESSENFDFPELNASEKIVVLADEAHRSQYGILGVALNTALPNAPKIAFTGTPLIKTEQTTSEFGTYIDTYTIEQAVEDGSTVQILYEGREAQTKVTGDSLDKLFDEYFGDKTDDEKLAIKKKYGTEKAVLEAPQRIRWICIDILRHYREHIQPNGFKAMVVTSSRHAATVYKQMLAELDAPESRVIISGDHNDPEYLRQYTDATKQKEYIREFTKPLKESPISILIVKDMLLTGFDAPVCQVMYLDRKITDHNLLQAIARVNRTHEGKQCGFIVDYYGLSDYVTEALEMFTSADVKGALKNLKEELPKLQACHTRAMKYFKAVDREDIDACVLVLKDEEVRQPFEIDFRKFAKQMDIIFPDTAATPYIPDLMFLGKVNQSAKNMYRDPQLDISGVGEKVRKLINDHIYATGVDPKIPPIDLLATNFKEHVSAVKSSKAKASEIEHAIKSHITINLENDPAYYKKLSEKLESIINNHGEHWDELVQQLFNFRENIENDRQRGAVDLGLTETEFAFHNILVSELARITDNDEIDKNVHKEVLQVTTRLVEMIDEASQIVDFFDKHDEVKKVQLGIKRELMECSFGDDSKLRSAVINGFMDLARVKFRQ